MLVSDDELKWKTRYFTELQAANNRPVSAAHLAYFTNGLVLPVDAAPSNRTDTSKAGFSLERQFLPTTTGTGNGNITLVSDEPTIAVSLKTSKGNFSSNVQNALESRKRIFLDKSLARPTNEGEPHVATIPHIPYMRHRLRSKLEFWKTFVKSTIVLKWIASGFDFRWRKDTGPPPSARFSNHSSAFANTQFVTSNLAELLQAGTIEKVTDLPHIISPLGVVPKKGSDKLRLIFDGQYLNSYLIIPSFKYEDLSFCSQYLKPNDYIITSDLSSGFHHLDIDPDFWTYLGFEWQGQYYVYTGMPFGVAPAPWAFTKLTRELLNRWRAMGHRCSGCIRRFYSC